jgi:hypothetical protein
VVRSAELHELLSQNDRGTVIAMPILITRVGDLYSAIVTPPHGRGASWRTEQPLPAPDLVGELYALGCHQTDIGDAFYEADPNWLNDQP